MKRPRPIAALQLDLFNVYPKLLKIHKPKPRTIAERRAERHVGDGAAAAGSCPCEAADGKIPCPHCPYGKWEAFHAMQDRVVTQFETLGL